MATPTSITLNWKSPDRPNGDIDSYQVDYYILGTIDQSDTTVENNNSSNTVSQSSNAGVSSQNLVKRSVAAEQIYSSLRNLGQDFVTLKHEDVVQKVGDNFGSEISINRLDQPQTEYDENILTGTFVKRTFVKRDTTQNGKSTETQNNVLPDWVSAKDKSSITVTCQVFIEYNPSALQTFDKLMLNYTTMLLSEGRTEESRTILKNVLSNWSDLLRNETVLVSNLSSTLQGVNEKLQSWIVENNSSVLSLCITLYNNTQGIYFYLN